MANVALARAYQQLFDSHPNVTLAIAGGSLTALGDVVAQISQRIVRTSPMFSEYSTRPPGQQYATRKDRQGCPSYDIARTLRFFCFGAGMS